MRKSARVTLKFKAKKDFLKSSNIEYQSAEYRVSIWWIFDVQY